MLLFKTIVKKFIKIYYLYLKKDAIAYSKRLGVQIGEHCQILADPQVAFGTEPWLIKLGNHVDITAGVCFLNHEGAMWCARWIDERYKSHDIFLPTVVGDNVMIGVNSLIMPGVHIGNNVVIGGHSVVTKDVPDGSIVAGVPAKQISTIERFMEKLKEKETFPTKQMDIEQKRNYLRKQHPEWFK